MNVSLTQELEGFVNTLVTSGMYYSASEVVRDGLRLLKEQEEIRRLRTDELRKEIMLGIESLRAGQSETFTTPEVLLEKVREGAKKKLAVKQNGKTK